MPFLDVKVSCTITKEKECSIIKALSKAIEIIPGKNESNLMIGITDNVRLWFKGSQDGGTAFINVMVKGKSPVQAYESFAKEASKIVMEKLSIPEGRVYVRFSETDNWLSF